MKAYLVRSKYPSMTQTLIRFGDTAGQAKARAIGTDEFHDHGLLELVAHREPKFDGRQDDPPTLLELVEDHGWVAECCECGCLLDRDHEITWRAVDRVCHARCHPVQQEPTP